jgi:hypothetical protein
MLYWPLRSPRHASNRFPGIRAARSPRRRSSLRPIKLEACRPFKARELLYRFPASKVSGPLVALTDYHLHLRISGRYALSVQGVCHPVSALGRARMHDQVFQTGKWLKSVQGFQLLCGARKPRKPRGVPRSVAGTFVAHIAPPEPNDDFPGLAHANAGPAMTRVVTDETSARKMMTMPRVFIAGLWSVSVWNLRFPFMNMVPGLYADPPGS